MPIMILKNIIGCQEHGNVGLLQLQKKCPKLSARSWVDNATN